MITTLPRGLRDIIYEYILCDKLYKDVIVSTNEPASSQAGLDYWQVEKVTDTALKELLGAWYRSVWFHMGEDLGYIERFLYFNVARLGILRHHLNTKISITFNQRDVVFLKKKPPIGGRSYQGSCVSRTSIGTTRTPSPVEARCLDSSLCDHRL